MTNLQKNIKVSSDQQIQPFEIEETKRKPIKPLLNRILIIQNLKAAKVFTKQGLLRKRDQKIIFREKKLDHENERIPSPLMDALKWVGTRLPYLKRILLDFSNRGYWAPINSLHSILNYFNSPKDLRIYFPIGYSFHGFDFRLLLKKISRFSRLETFVFNIRTVIFTNMGNEEVPYLADALQKMRRLKVLSIELDGSGEIALCDGDSDPLWGPISRMRQLKFFRYFDFTLYEDPQAGVKSEGHFTGLCNTMNKMNSLRGIDLCFWDCDLNQEVMKSLRGMLVNMKWLEYERIMLQSVEENSFGKKQLSKIVDAFDKSGKLKEIHLCFGGSKKMKDKDISDLEKKFQKLTGLPEAKLEIFVYDEDNYWLNKTIEESKIYKRFLGCHPFEAI